MAAKSKHWGDVYKWIIKVIHSCTTRKQLSSTRNLIRNFDKQYPNQSNLTYELKMLESSHYYTIT